MGLSLTVRVGGEDDAPVRRKEGEVAPHRKEVERMHEIVIITLGPQL
jgi:hypothetical protein